MTTYMYLSTKRSNKNQNTRFSITDITKQYFSKLLKKFDNSPYLGYNIKHDHNEPTEDYFFLIKHITKLIKSERYIQLHTNFLNRASMKQLGASTKQYNLINCKAST